ncbi:hypothetical protein SEA_PATIO_49 [Gordonia phage Patio]|uniref:DUF7233 domain-containing protein n=1 Tax=Gordonia phage Patio TaxID=2041515 RepID=A0A2D2W4M1_9CAUD|nr:hypothetical protein KNT76_gp49 [Gordonia phage Patio]ATS93131.1 hypothetical protein SEA_PATIO_49 [Gordonia phage Patio]QXN74431.1 hypothetical protein SEA_FLOAT294_48 [Gordonia phage Float294]
MDQGTTVVTFETELWIEFGSYALMPVDTEILYSSIEDRFIVAACATTYDYGPFSDGYTPAFEFEGLRISASLFGEIDSAVVTCISSPSGDGSRITTIKE